MTYYKSPRALKIKGQVVFTFGRKCTTCGKRFWWSTFAGKKHCGEHSRQKGKVKQQLTFNYILAQLKIRTGRSYCRLCGGNSNLTIHHVGGGYKHMTILCESCHTNHEAHVTKECSLIAWFIAMITPFDPTPIENAVEWTRYKRKEYGETTTVVWRRVLA